MAVKAKAAAKKPAAPKVKKIKVLFATGEAVPFVKTGGLADVAGALPMELKTLGVEPAIILPEYRGIRDKWELKSTGIKVSVPIQVKEDTVIKVGEVFEADLNGLRAFFIRNDEYFDREFLYGTPKGDYEDNCPRFVFYSRGVIEFLRVAGFEPAVIHCHDWQSVADPALHQDPLQGRPGGRQDQDPAHHPQPGLPGHLLEIRPQADRPGRELFHSRISGILR